MDKRINIWINGKEVENNIKSIRSAMIHLTNQLNKMEIGSEEYIQTSKKLRDLKAIYDEHCKSLKMTNQEIENDYSFLSQLRDTFNRIALLLDREPYKPGIDD